MLKFMSLCSLMCALFAVQGKAAVAISAQLQQKYDAVQSMEAQFSQTIIHKESGARETRTGILYFKKPLLVRWETLKPDKELLIVNASAIWNVFPDEEVAYKYPASMVHETHNIFLVITGRSRLEQDFFIEDQGMESNLRKLHLIPKEPVQTLVDAVFWVDPKTMLIRKFRLTDFYGTHNEITLTSYKLGVDLSASKFAYVPDRGIIVEDRSERSDFSGTNFLP